MFFKVGSFFLYKFIGLLGILVGYNSLIMYNKKYYTLDKENEFS